MHRQLLFQYVEPIRLYVPMFTTLQTSSSPTHYGHSSHLSDEGGHAECTGPLATAPQ